MRSPVVFLSFFLSFCGFAAAQLIPAGQPIPKGPNPPVVFVNGYQSPCGGSFSDSFYAADKLLQANSIVTLFFDNCSVGGEGGARPSLEAEGVAFGKFLASLKYTDGTPVTQVDVVGHSLGGLIIRTYLSGKQDVTPAVFTPPAAVPIRKAVFLATPNFGTPIATLLGSSSDKQLQEMSPGSQFLFDLNSWNQGNDDLRGISAIAVAGNGGAETQGISGFDDGVVSVTSASLGFYRPGVTRVIPDCHVLNSLLQLVGYCSASTPAVNNINTDPNNQVSRILISFLTGTDDWKSVGTAAEATPSLSRESGLILQLRDMNDTPIPTIRAVISAGFGTVNLPANGASNLVYSDTLSAELNTLKVSPLSGPVQDVRVDLTSSATTELPAVVKPGPVINPKGVIPAAGPAPFPYDVAPGAYVSIYGTNLASATGVAGIPYPNHIDDVQVLVDGVPQQVQFVSSGQINFVYSDTAAGLTKLTVKNMNGQNTVNVRVAPAVPSLFLLDNGRAAALNALTGAIVGPDAPLHVKDFISIYLTGLGDATKFPPTVTIGGMIVPTLYAGLTPGYAGLNQINGQIPAGIATGNAVPVVVTSNGRSSNVATIAIQ